MGARHRQVSPPVRDEPLVSLRKSDGTDAVRALHARVVHWLAGAGQELQAVDKAPLAAVEDALPRGDMILMVEADTPGAQALYERCGYAGTGRAPNSCGRARHGIWMQKARGVGHRA